MKKFLDAQWQIICTQAEKIIQKYEDDENKVQEIRQALDWLNGKRSLLTGRLVRHEHDAHMWTQLYEMGQGG